MSMRCAECGHDVALTEHVRPPLARLRGARGSYVCYALDRDDVGGGLAGFGPCGCTAADHEKKPRADPVRIKRGA